MNLQLEQSSGKSYKYEMHCPVARSQMAADAQNIPAGTFTRQKSQHFLTIL
jgi:hypothetical protein